MRTVEFHIEDIQSYIIDNAVDGFSFERAVGYLSTWSPTSYPLVRIWSDRDGDIIATYHKASDEPPGYVIGGVYNHEVHCYSFHS